MTDFDRTNTGALFKNAQKATEKHPDYKGTINVNGQEFWLSSWLKTSKQGDKYMSLSVQPKDAQETRQAPTTRTEPPPYRKPSQDAARARQTAPQPRFEDDSDLPPF
jgi:hypothetical protein